MKPPAPSPILIGNTFPLSLVRRPVKIEPVPVETLHARLAGGDPVHSFWGHANSLPHASALAGIDLTPGTSRPALVLTVDGLPSLNGLIFHECWVLSPDYIPGYRPTIGEEIPLHNITGWQVLRIEWENTPTPGDFSGTPAA